MSVIQRLTFECGHLRLSGPWDSLMQDGRDRHMIGDLHVCYICPKTKELGGRAVWTIRQIVNVELIPPGSYRKPDPDVDRARTEQGNW